jgi:hypothetical protein
MQALITPSVLAIAVAVAWPAARLVSQSLTVSTVSGALQVRAPGFHFIAGEPLARLKDGQTVSVELAVSVLPNQGASAAAQRRDVFVLSYDLWEERFAVRVSGTPPRTISHLSPAAAEAWCLQQLAVPVDALGSLGRNVPFWVRLDYRVLNGSSAPERDRGGLTLGGLIEVFSRRQAGEIAHSIEAGPFRVQP